MELNFPSNRMIDLTQAFDAVMNTDLTDTIYRFGIYKTTPSNLLPLDRVEYFSLYDSESGDSALIGVLYIILPGKKTLQIRTKVCITQGDTEEFQYVCEELIERLSQKKIEELKKRKGKRIPEQG
jgi:hypothetical protein